MREDREFTATTPLGPEVAAFSSMTGHDEISRPFRFDLGLVSRDYEIKAESLLGKPVGIKVGPGEGVRFFHGIVSEFRLTDFREGHAHYVATLRPWLWFLSTAHDNRIFQHKSVVEIVEEVFSAYPDAHFDNRLQGTYAARDFCVQYGESDLDFVQRLLEHEGIGYFFEYEEEKHTLVLFDDNSVLAAAPGFETVEFEYDDKLTFRDGEFITRWVPRTSVRAGAFAHTDYDFTKPSADLMARSQLPKGHDQDDREVYQFPGTYEELSRGDDLAAIRREELQAPHVRVEAGGTVRGLSAGHKFKLELFPREAENVEHIVIRAEYTMWDDEVSAGMERPGEGYAVSLLVAPHSLPFRPERRTRRPVMKGLQTAVVVGPAGEEIFTDEYARVKVQFFWDRHGARDENSSCWVRVSSTWAGSGWGFIQIPRIGQEVIIDFIEGDPDRPMIVGRVYNAEQMPPYGLPGNATQSGWKSNSSPGGGGWNELRFEDRAGEEEVYFQAQKDHRELVKNNETRRIGHNFAEDVGNDAQQSVARDRTESVGRDKSTEVGQDRTVVIGRNDTETVGVNRSLTVGANETISVGNNSSETIGMNHDQKVGMAQMILVSAGRTDKVGLAESRVVGGVQTLTVGLKRNVRVGSNQAHHVQANDATTVKGNQTFTVGKNHSSEIGGNQVLKLGGDQSYEIGGGRLIRAGKGVTHDAGEDVLVRAGKAMMLQAADSLTLKCGDASIQLKKDGTITIKGKDILIDGSGKINAKASGDMILKGSKITQN